MKRNFFKTVIVVLMIALALFAVSCSQDAGSSGLNGSGKATEDSPSWLCMFYLDLSDLPGLSNLNEICAAVNSNSEIFNSGNCDMYIMTGGAKSGNAVFSEDDDFTDLYAAVDNNYNAFATSQSANKYQYWKLVVNKNKAYLSPVTFSTKAMSDSNVLYDFMNKCYSLKDYSGSKIVLNLWDHGGGSYQGLIWDHSISTQPGMSLSELKTALAKFKANHKVIDCINFDMCLMSSAEVVYTLYNNNDLLANYMCASEPTAAGRGSSYKDWVKFLYANKVDGSKDYVAEFTDCFCSTAIKACSDSSNENDYDDGAVWSAIDVSKWGTFSSTYETFLSELKKSITSENLASVKTTSQLPNEAKGSGSELYTNGMYDIWQVARQIISEDQASTIKTALNSLLTCYIADGSSLGGTKGSRSKDITKKAAYGLSMCILTSSDASADDPAYSTYVRDCVSPGTIALYNKTLTF